MADTQQDSLLLFQIESFASTCLQCPTAIFRSATGNERLAVETFTLKGRDIHEFVSDLLEPVVGCAR